MQPADDRVSILCERVDAAVDYLATCMDDILLMMCQSYLNLCEG